MFLTALSTILLHSKAEQKGGYKPVDKSVIKLWKDAAEGRSYWLGATLGCTCQSCRMPGATRPAFEGQAKKFKNTAQSLVASGLQLLHLPPKTVDRPVDKVRAYGCRPGPVPLVAY